MTIIFLQFSNDQQPERKRSGVYKAAEEGNLEQIKKFIESGVDLNQRDEFGHTPLELAAFGEHANAAKILLEAGAMSSSYLLEEVLLHDDAETAIVLIEGGVTVNSKFEDGDTVLMMASASGLLSVARKLVAVGADVNAVNRHGSFALLNAARNGWHELFNYLYPLTDPNLRLRAEAELPAGTLYRRRVDDTLTENFIYAAGSGNVEAVSELILNKVNIDAIGSSGTSALWIAAWWGHINIVQILVQSGASVDIKEESSGRTPLMAAAHMSASKEHGVGFVDADHIAVMQYLIGAGASVEARDRRGWTPLITSVNASSLNAVRLLLQSGVDVNTRDYQMRTALFHAENKETLSYSDKINCSEIVGLLREDGAEL